MHDLLLDAIRDANARRAKSLIIIVVVTLSIAGLIASRVVAVTAVSQIDEQLAATALDEVRIHQIHDRSTTFAPSTTDPTRDLLTEQSAGAVRSISHVNSVSRYLPISPGERPIVRVHGGPAVHDVRVVGVDDSYFEATDAQLTTASISSAWNTAAGEQVALVGESVAAELGIVANGYDQSFRFGVQRFTVVGVVSSLRDPKLSQSILIPADVAEGLREEDDHWELLVRTQLGYSNSVSSLAPDLAAPGQAAKLAATGAESLGDLRTGVATNVDSLLMGVGIVLWILTLVIVANATLSSVISRTSEIGLRRALGFSREHIVLKFLVEGGLLGSIGGLCGVGIGILSAIATTVALGWVPLVPLWFLAAGPIAGTLTGLIATIYPSLKAATIRPAEAVRSD